jgi:membrane fusion protein, multidrug efflux system
MFYFQRSSCMLIIQTEMDNNFNSLNLVLFVINSMFILFQCSVASPEDHKPNNTNTTRGATKTKVITATSTFTTLTYTVQSNGRIVPQYTELLLSERSGLLLTYRAHNNQSVKKDEIIATLESTTLDLRREKLLIQQYNAQKEYESQLLGYEGLLKGKSQQEAEEVRKKLRAAAGLAGIEVELKELDYEKQQSIIRAPVSGVLSDVKVQAGMHIKAGQELFRIHSAHDLYAEVKVLESDLPLLRIGQSAEVQPLAMPAKTYAATLSEINPGVDANGMIQVRLKIKSPAGLLPGMNVEASVNVPQKKAVVVPKAAVVLRGGRLVVFTYENGLAKWNYVTTGLDNGREIEIIEGIKFGMEVITSNNLQISHDAPVKK